MLPAARCWSSDARAQALQYHLQALHARHSLHGLTTCEASRPGRTKELDQQAAPPLAKQNPTQTLSAGLQINTTLPKIGNVKRLQLDIHNQ